MFREIFEFDPLSIDRNLYLFTKFHSKQCGIDVIGWIEPIALNGHRFILVAIDCLTKLVETISYANITK